MLDRLRPASALERDDSLESYLSARERFFARHGSRWPGALADPFDLLDVRELDAEAVRAIEAATASIGAIYRRLRPILHHLPDQALLAMGVRPETLELARTTIPGLDMPVLARLDLAHTCNGLKLLEYNGDAPGLVVETFGLKRLAKPTPSDYRKVDGPQAAAMALAGALEYVEPEKISIYETHDLFTLGGND